MAGKLPYMPFFVADWTVNDKLRRCSKAAKGFWIDLLCFLWGSEERGVAVSQGVPLTDREIAEVVGGDVAENLILLAELCAKGVAKRRADTAIFSSRIIRDEKNRRRDAAKKRRQRRARSNGADVPPHVPPPVPATDSDSNSLNGTKKRKKFIAPSVEEVRDYCHERKNGVNPEKFVAFYESKGWLVGKSPMRDWKAAMRANWEGKSSGLSRVATDADRANWNPIDGGTGHE